MNLRRRQIAINEILWFCRNQMETFGKLLNDEGHTIVYDG